MVTLHTDVSISMLAQVVAGRTPPLELLTVDQVQDMVAHGILSDGAPVELIDGLLIRKDRSARGEDPMTHNPAHAACVKRLLRVFSQIAAHGCHLQCQLPLALSPIRAPEPDLAIILGKLEDFDDRHPEGKDSLLVVEVADSSLDYDRSTKQQFYAAAAIPVYWIANLIDKTVEVYEQPDAAAGKYLQRRECRSGESIRLSLPSGASIEVRVDEIIG
jgi:hypothetical protein